MLAALRIILYFLALAWLSNNVILAASYFKYQDPITELWGVKDNNHKIIILPQYEQIAISDNGEIPLFSKKSIEGEFLIPVIKFGIYWRVDIKAKIKFASVFYDNGHDYYKEGLARFIVDKKVGFHNKMAEIVIEPIYDFAYPFDNEHSYVCNECWGSYLSPVTFYPLSSNALSQPREDIHKEIIGGKWGAIDKTGKIILPLNYSSWREADTALKNFKTNN